MAAAFGRLPAEMLQNILRWVEPEDLARLSQTNSYFRDFLLANQTLYRELYLDILDTPPDAADLDWKTELQDFVRLQKICASTSSAVVKAREAQFVADVVFRLLRNASSSSSSSTISSFTAVERVSPPTLSPSPTSLALASMASLALEATVTPSPAPSLSASLAPTPAAPSSRNAVLLARMFRSEDNKLHFLCRSHLFQRAETPGGQIPYRVPPLPAWQLSAKLHCLYGKPILMHYYYDHDDDSADADTPRTPAQKLAMHIRNFTNMHRFAMSRVYDVRRYMENPRWGPFLASEPSSTTTTTTITTTIESADNSGDDGNDTAAPNNSDTTAMAIVDWEQLEAIMIDVSHNLQRLRVSFRGIGNHWEKPFVGSWPHSYRHELPPAPTTTTPTLHDDPYGVSGTWLRVVCSIGVDDFRIINSIAFHLDPRDPVEVFAASVGGDVFTGSPMTRFSVATLQVVRVERCPEGHGAPVTFFKGTIRLLGADGGPSGTTSGSVRTNAQGDVCWSISTWDDDGREQLRFESVQVGGVRSARGLLGSWIFPGSPRMCGSAASWKVSDLQDADLSELTSLLQQVWEDGEHV